MVQITIYMGGFCVAGLNFIRSVRPLLPFPGKYQILATTWQREAIEQPTSVTSLFVEYLSPVEQIKGIFGHHLLALEMFQPV